VVLAFPQARAAGQGAVSTVAPVRVNAGGGAYLTRSHVSWAADRGFAGGWSWSTRSRIAGTGEPGLFQTQRFGARGYELPVGAPGRFRVKLLLAEGQFSARGKRVFDVSAEGRAALRNVDIFAAKGRNAYMPTFDTQVTDGRLSLGFTARRYVAAVAGIEAVYLGPLPAMTTPTTTTGPGAVDGQQLYVSPSGSDQQPGTAAEAPLRTIQAALDKATAGTTIHLAPGVYAERLVTKAGGTAQAPITIQGPESGLDRAGRYQAVLTATGRVVSINHSHVHLRGFTIDGQPALATTIYPSGYDRAESFKLANQPWIADGRLVYVGAADSSRDITGVVIDDMFLSGRAASASGCATTPTTTPSPAR